MKTTAVGIRELRDNLSRYIREVRSGVRVLVLDRDEVVAEIHEPTTRYAPVDQSDAVMDMVRAGTLTLPKRRKTPCERSPVRLPSGTGRGLLDADRTDRSAPVR